jgi:hypothetical protein
MENALGFMLYLVKYQFYAHKNQDQSECKAHPMLGDF